MNAARRWLGDGASSIDRYVLGGTKPLSHGRYADSLMQMGARLQQTVTLKHLLQLVVR